MRLWGGERGVADLRDGLAEFMFVPLVEEKATCQNFSGFNMMFQGAGNRLHE